MRDESGQVAILVALLSVALLSSVALAVDVGAGYEARRTLQNGVDAAALAGAQDLAEGRGEAVAEETAADYLRRNLGQPVDEVTVAFPDAARVSVNARIIEYTFLARIFGRTSFPVKAQATASTGLANSVENLVPIIVPWQSVTGHVGPDSQTVFELGEDRPLESLSITYRQSGNRVTYTVAYVNTANKAVDIEMWSPIPAGAAYVAGSATAGGAFNGTDVRWQWTQVASGDRRAAEFEVDFSGPVNPRNEVFARTNGNSVESASTDQSQRGFFWLVDFANNANGTPDFASWIVNGYREPVGLGSVANGTGVRSALKAALDERLAEDASVVLPLYDYTEGGGSGGVYHVVGFAEFVIAGFDLNGNPKSVTGYFTDGTVTAGAGGAQNPPDFGIKVVWLSE